MATRGRGQTRTWESRNEQPADNHAEFMAAMANLANIMEANAAATLQAVQRLGQPAGNGNRNGEGNANDNAEGNDDNTGGVPITLATFLKVHPPTFRGSTNPTEADHWFQAMERALQAQHVPLNQYVEFAAYQLAGEAQPWWQAECRLLQLQNTDTPWEVFQAAFYYTNKFEELCRFSRVCQGAPETYESWKCIKYQRGLKDSIMTSVAPMKIRVFSDLVNKARVVEEYVKTMAASKETHKGSSSRGRGKYFHPRGKLQERRICASRCFHPYDSCKIGLGGCFSCGLPSHIARDCTRGRNQNVGQSQHQGRVFTVNAKDASKADPLMRGICLIGDKSLVALYDTGASHSFISFAKVEELSLKVSELPFDLHVHTPHQTVMTSGKECQGYILLDANALGDAQNLDQILVVRDFPEVFPEDIPEFSPQKEIEFVIELVPGARSVMIAPYRMF
ncbi:uncharacterized protein LOC107640728 [Arachis ipaensis]|uniref:uncharacterized protein LOC107640728 n=1 Tax=Arachis ipaensis TaxID=130454 RepID=UPI0007AFBB2D|nr:uncharacterized protein LOC107640728 [Arachis ipaensis]